MDIFSLAALELEREKKTKSKNYVNLLFDRAKKIRQYLDYVNRGQKETKKYNIDKDWLYEQYYIEGRTLKDIAKEKKCSVGVIWTNLKKI